MQKVIEERYAKPVEKAKAMCQEAVKANEQAIWQEEGQKYLWEAKKVRHALYLEVVVYSCCGKTLFIIAARVVRF